MIDGDSGVWIECDCGDCRDLSSCFLLSADYDRSFDLRCDVFALICAPFSEKNGGSRAVIVRCVECIIDCLAWKVRPSTGWQINSGLFGDGVLSGHIDGGY